MKTTFRYFGLPLCGGLLLTCMAWVFVSPPGAGSQRAAKSVSVVKPIAQGVKGGFLFFTEIRDDLFPVLKSLNQL